MATPTMDTIYQAISALYDNPNAAEKEKASHWLADVQKSIHSWKIADELLQEKKTMQTCYFAAQTMRSKIQHNLSELPSEAIISLRDSLVSHLEATSPTDSPAVLTQLSLALADLALQMPSWQNCIGELIKSFSNKNDFALLEILTVLPQEIDSSNLKLGENRRLEIKAELQSHSNLVSVFLRESITNSNSTDVALKIVKCLTSWMQVRAVNIQEVPQNAVVGYCLQVLRDTNSMNIMHDAATDCICALLHCFEDNNNNDSVERLLFESVAGLEESYHMSVAHEEEDKASNYARLFTELAETFLEKIVLSATSGNAHFAMRSLELCLVCVGHHDYEIAEITFNLWYRLSEECYQRDYQPLTDTFKPHIERLIEALARHCQCEPDHMQLPEEGDDFFDFRCKVMDLIKDVAFIVGSSSVFRQMFSTLDNNNSWEQTEAALFVMQAVGKNILPDEYQYVPKVVEAILSMPATTHPAVRKTCILLLGELCEWIEQHGECLPPCLELLITALQDKQLQYAASLALQNVIKACRTQAATHAPTLLEAARRADQWALPPSASAALMRAVAAALGTLPNEQLSAAMREVVSFQLTELSNLVKANKEVKKNTSTDPAIWLDRLAALFRDVEPPPALNGHPCLLALSDAWPVLHEVMNKYGADGRVMERWCRAVRFAVRCTRRHAAPLLPPLAQALTTLYAHHAHSCLLYLGSVLLDELGGEPSCVQPLIDLLQELMPRAFQLLQQPSGLKDNPDTVDDLFRLFIRFLQRIPLQFLSCGAMPAVIQCAILACSLDHREANSSVMKFLHDLMRCANAPQDDRQQVKALADSTLVSYGESLTYALIEASVLHLHSYMLSDVAEVLCELVKWQRLKGVDWIGSSLQKLPRDRTAVATENQCGQFHHYVMSAEKYREVTKLLREFARLYR